MNLKLKKLIGKLNNKHSNFEFSIKNTTVGNSEVINEEGNEVVISTFTTIVNLVIFDLEKLAPNSGQPMIMKTVNGQGSGLTAPEALENARINAINLINIF